MKRNHHVVAGIDVGGPRRGFHAAILRGRRFESINSTDPGTIVDWCREHKAEAVGIDAPCGWSASGSSRTAERDLMVAGQRLHCFATPTLAAARAHTKGFYDWVFNGERLYDSLKRHYQLFDNTGHRAPVCFETFPHAIVSVHAGHVVPAKLKVSRRRKLLRDLGFDDASLPNIDFVDAALCALAARTFLAGRTEACGCREEGYIVVPKFNTGMKGRK